MNNWSDFGDENPLEHGGLWLRQDEDFATSFYVVELTVLDAREVHGDELYIVSEGYVDLTDSWIDWRSVSNETFDLEDASEYMGFVLDAVRHYGMAEFGGALMPEFVTRDVAVSKLIANGIRV